MIRLFVNIADSSYADNDEGGGGTDVVSLQNENDNLKFRIIEKDGAIKSKDETLERLRDENQKLSTSQAQSRNVILALEQKLESNRVLIAAHNDQVLLKIGISYIMKVLTFIKFYFVRTCQVKALRSRLGEIDDLRIKLKEANDKNRTVELVQHLIYASQQDTDELLKEGRSITEMATMVATLKRELRNSNAKRAQIRSNAEELNRQLKACKEEKSYVLNSFPFLCYLPFAIFFVFYFNHRFHLFDILCEYKFRKLEEKCSVLESRVFQLENINDSKNNSTDRFNSSGDSMIENRSPTAQQAQQPQSSTVPVKRTFGDHLTFHKKSVKLESSAGRHPSPSMLVKASSIAGLSPLLKRTKSAESHKLSPIGNADKSDTFSILRKPRLIQNQTKKSELRPIRLNKASTLSTVDEKSNTDTQSTNRNYASVNGQISSFNNKFRLGGLSKPN